jgi:hypothetical protein
LFLKLSYIIFKGEPSAIICSINGGFPTPKLSASVGKGLLDMEPSGNTNVSNHYSFVYNPKRKHSGDNVWCVAVQNDIIDDQERAVFQQVSDQNVSMFNQNS